MITRIPFLSDFRTCGSLILAALVASCGSGTVGILGSSSSSSSSNGRPDASDLSVTGTREGIDFGRAPRSSPALIKFRLSDEEEDDTDVTLAFRFDGDDELHPMTLVRRDDDPSAPPVSFPVRLEADGRERSFYWYFTEESLLNPGGAENYITVPLVEDLRIVVDVQGGSNAFEIVDVGNDPPKILNQGLQTPDLDEYSGSIPFVFDLEDSSADLCLLRAWYQYPGQAPETVFPVGHTPGPNVDPPEFAMENLESSPTSVPHVFVWDSPRNVPGREEQGVQVLFQAFDGLSSSTVQFTPSFVLDNNAPPEAILLNDAVVADSDQRRLLPIPVFVRDAEGDAAEIFIQWRRDEQPFIPLITATVRDHLDDPRFRIQNQICTELPIALGGYTAELEPLPVSFDPARLHVRLPELATSAAGLLERGLTGRVFETLRPRARFETDDLGGELEQPVAALPLGDGTRALVLDHSGANWRLQDASLVDGESIPRATGASSPVALALEPDEAHAIVASDQGGGWLIERVRLSGQAPHVQSSLAGDGMIRGVAFHSALGVYASVYDALESEGTLLHVDLEEQTVTVVQRFEEAWGLAVDPIHPSAIYVADHMADRIFHVDLMTSVKATVSAGDENGTVFKVPTPRAIALENGGRRLLVTDDDGVLRGLELRHPVTPDLQEDPPDPPYPPLYEIETPVGAFKSIASGEAGLRIAALHAKANPPELARLALAGGTNFRREIAGYDPQHRIVTLLGPENEDPIPTGVPWQIRDLVNPVLPPPITPMDPDAGIVEIFLWDTSDAGGGGDLQLRVFAFDSDLGLPTEGVSAKRILIGPEGVSEAGDERIVDDTEFAHPVTLAAADFDLDGDIDFASIPTGEGEADNRLVIYPQTLSGTYNGASVILECAPEIVDASDLIAADLDGDEFVELVVASAGDGNLRIVTVTSPPLACGPIQTLSLLGEPVSVVAADMDSDGRIDLIVAEASPNAVGVFLQDPVFDPVPVYFPIMSEPKDLAAADLNDDGLIDLALATDAGLQVLYQLTPTTFEVCTVDPQPISAVAVADLNGDGSRDLVTATDELASDLLVHLRDPDSAVCPGNFLTPRGIGTGERSTALVVADLDGNGTLDVASANLGPEPEEEDGSVTVFYQDLPHEPGDLGVFTPDIKGPLFSSFTPGIRPNALLAADLDGDDLLELAAATQNDLGGYQDGAGIAIYENSGPGLYVSPSLGLLGGPGLTPDPDDFATADLDGDGDLDIVIASGQPGEDDQSLLVFKQTAPGAFVETLEPATEPDLMRDPLGVEAVDYDGDGVVDLVSFSNVGGVGFVQIFKRAGEGYVREESLSTAEDIEQIDFGDLDGDGDIDLIALTGDALEYFLQREDHTFEQNTVMLVPAVIGSPRALAVGDLGGGADNRPDGLQDLVVATDLGIVVYHGYPPQEQTSLIPYPPVDGVNVTAISVADVDADGRLDVAVGNNFGTEEPELDDEQAIYLFLQRAQASAPQQVELKGGGAASGVVILDFDSDGDMDVLSVNVNNLTSPPTVSPPVIFSQVRPGAFQKVPGIVFCNTELFGPYITHAIAADIDGDGETDLVGAYRDASIIQVCFGGH